jgi:hypothetical protein
MASNDQLQNPMGSKDTLNKSKSNATLPKKRTIDIGSSFFFSNWLYLWTFTLISQVRTRALSYNPRKALRRLRLRLPDDLSTRTNGRIVQEAWQAELNENPDHPTILNALRRSYSTHYFWIGQWKVLWALFTWIGMSIGILSASPILVDVVRRHSFILSFHRQAQCLSYCF